MKRSRNVNDGSKGSGVEEVASSYLSIKQTRSPSRALGLSDLRVVRSLMALPANSQVD